MFAQSQRPGLINYALLSPYKTLYPSVLCFDTSKTEASLFCGPKLEDAARKYKANSARVKAITVYCGSQFHERRPIL